MSDFDTVLERLLSDPSFQAALARDPAAALAGYDLTADELDVLHAQVTPDTGGDRSVETRTSKAGMVGLLGPIGSAFGLAGGGAALGAAPAHEAFGGAPPHPVEGFGSADGSDSFGAKGAQSFGAKGAQSFGSAPTGHTEGFGQAPESGTPGRPDAVEATRVEATGYQPRVDADGDGHWDRYTAYERPDGGVDIEADTNHDGRVDFVGHDVDRDGRVDSADYDDNFDGTLDTRMYDDNGDGWLDRGERLPRQ